MASSIAFACGTEAQAQDDIGAVRGGVVIEASPLDVLGDGTGMVQIVRIGTPGGTPLGLVRAGPRDDRGTSAVRLAPDKPQPAIVIGFIRPEDRADFGVVTPLDDLVFPPEDWQARARLRAASREDYERLVRSGRIDPPTEDRALKEFLQTDLARMRCYTNRSRTGPGPVDGDFGGGSRTGVQRYYEKTATRTPDDRSASVPLYREMMLVGPFGDPDICDPYAVVASSNGRAPAGGNARRPTNPPSPPPRPEPGAGNDGGNGGNGSGLTLQGGGCMGCGG
ncbi:MAG: hypothetical protein ACU0CO_14450 [Shimia sp.]